ncbi:kinase-like protein [Polyplosphaeria fusca]|uniref:non-specific serine/threonine protein kinase n=1 Tax=Polyplosphaeria fusca TaxID=682080 RepID=A0A9P4R8N8_9PLEO|nr:kinase-like protein [Polyplosphaeria fusca]
MGTKTRAIQQAKEMETLVAERAKRSGDEAPPYDFYELIGKGSYGRVFKGLNRETKSLVAIKIIDIDKVDYEEMTTKNLSETLKEISILQQLRDSRAQPYVNIIEEARNVHNELWIVSEYASGGSVHTLMKPTMTGPNPGLEEKFIIPIARELALGLKYIHEAGVLHRDLKCNNILILEEGRVQLCDFGVSNTLEPEIAKRSTIVGTPYWMAPEIQKEWVKDADPTSRTRPNEILYGSEVDIWAYGCTLFEMATGFPPFHKTAQFQLPEAGIPELEGDRFSPSLKNLVSFVLQENPTHRPTPDDILQHELLLDSTKMHPTVTLVALVQRYYQWEKAGGARVSLFWGGGAQAPDPLAPEPEDEDDDWTFSTSDDFRRFSEQFPDAFSIISEQGFSLNTPIEDEDRFAKLQAQLREEQANRGKRRLDRLFDKNSTPYRYSGFDSDRPPSDLILRDFNPGAPNRETVIDLDFAAPTIADVPSIDLGEVPTVKANRINSRLLRELELEDELEEERDSFDQDQDQYDRRATRDWKFPSNRDSNRNTMGWKFPAAAEKRESNRNTMGWKFPTQAEKPNRRTVEWTFDAAVAEANYEPMPKGPRLSRRRDTQELDIPLVTAPLEENRRTGDFFSSSPTLGPGFRPTLRHATTEPMGSFDDYPRISSAPGSPIRTSMIDLDDAYVDEFRPSTADSATTSTYTGGTDQLNGNPFDLEDQVHLSQNNNRASYHMKSQSEPNHAIPGLLTPQTYDDQGYPINQDSHHPAMHARGVSSVSQMQAKPPPNNMPYARSRPPQSHLWDGWSHQQAYGISSDESPPASISTDASEQSDEPSVDDLWDAFEHQTLRSQRRNYSRLRRQTDSLDTDPRSDAEDNYADTTTSTSTSATSSTYYDPSVRTSRVSVGPHGKPLLEFPVPRGPDPEALLVGGEADGVVMENALWKSTVELRDGLRAARDLLRAMRLEEVRLGSVEEGGSGGGGMGTAEEEFGGGTVRAGK